MIEWKELETKGKHLKVSNQGDVINLNYYGTGKQKPVPTSITKHGYVQCIGGIHVHRLVAEAFIGPIPDGHVINHIDGNKQNNHVSNLEIVTPSENTKHAYKEGLKNHKPCKIIMPDGEELKFDSINESYEYLSERHGLTLGKFKQLLNSGEPWKRPQQKYKELKNLMIERISS